MSEAGQEAEGEGKRPRGNPNWVKGRGVKKEKRPPGNPNWIKGGPSSNPSGRSKHAFDIQALARERTPMALAALERAIANDGPQAVTAANTLLAYGYGRPIQTQNIRVIKDIGELSDTELQAIANYEPAAAEALAPPEIEGKAEDASE